MTAMLILDGVFMAMIVAAILTVLMWGILTDRTRVVSLARRTRQRARTRARVTATRPAAGRQYGRVPDLSAR